MHSLTYAHAHTHTHAFTQEDIVELEKAMGIDMKSFAKMMKGGSIDKTKLAGMGAGIEEVLDIFQKLADLKK
jgi:hypothetical protein